MFIPLFYQLVEAYHPISTREPIAIVSPVPLTSPTGVVLGATSTNNASPGRSALADNDPIGGEGQMITVAVLGDSMIETLGKDLSPLKVALQKYYPNYGFYLANFGQSATTMDKAAERLPEIIALKPDIIVVESFAYNNYGNTQNGFDKQWKNLSEITTKIKQGSPHSKIILAATIAPNSVTFANGVKDLHLSSLDKLERTKTIKLYLQNLANFANSQGFPLANAYQQSLVNGEGNQKLISSTDNLHPSDSGKTFFSDILASAISQNKLIE